MRKLIVVVSLLPALAVAQAVSTPKPPQSTWLRNNRALWLAFHAPGCYATADVSGHGGTATIARNRAAFYADTSGALVSCAVDNLRVGPAGPVLEPAATNYLLHSMDLSVGAAATAPWTTLLATVSTSAGGFGAYNWTQVDNSGSAFGALYQVATVPPLSVVVGSVYARKPSGAGAASITVETGSVLSACACWRSDGGACTSALNSPSAGQCTAAVSNLGTTAVRIAAIATETAPSATANLYLIPGLTGVSVGVTQFAGAQIEEGTAPTSLIVTAGATATRPADVVTFTAP